MCEGFGGFYFLKGRKGGGRTGGWEEREEGGGGMGREERGRKERGGREDGRLGGWEEREEGGWGGRKERGGREAGRLGGEGDVHVVAKAAESGEVAKMARRGNQLLSHKLIEEDDSAVDCC